MITHCCASVRMSIGLRNRGLDDRPAAIVRMGSRQLNIVPKISICKWVVDALEVSSTGVREATPFPI